MPGQNIIEVGFDIEKLTAEKKEVLDLFVDLFGKLQAYDGTKFNPLGGGGLADLKKSVADNAKAIADLQAGYVKYNETITANAQKQAESKKATDDTAASGKAAASVVYAQTASFDNLTRKAAENQRALKDNAQAQKDLEKAYQGGAVSLDQYNSESAKLIGQQNSIKVANAEVTRSLSLMEKQTQAATGSQQQLEVILFNLKADYAALSGAQRDSQSGNIMLKEIQELDAEVKNINYSVGQFQRNVGNYSGSFVKAFDALKEELTGVNVQLAEIEVRGKSSVTNLTGANPIGFDNNRHKEGGDVTDLAGGASSSSILESDSVAYQKLTLQQKILEGSLERQTIGFKTANQEMRNAKATLDALKLAGLENTEGFEKLNLAYSTTGQKLKDLHGEQAILSSDEPALTALTAAAKGLGGAYALGAGASALFANGNEKVEKELNKLVAIMTFLQGLEEATKALKEKNAIATALEESATKALNVVRELEIKWFGKAKTAIVEDSTAKSVNTGATEANSAATEVNTVAMEATAVATEEAAGATVELSTALLTTGLGAVIIAIGVGVAFLVQHLINLAEADTKAAEHSADLAEELEKTNEILLEQIKLSDEAAEKQKKNLENALTLAEKNKQSEKDLLAIRQTQADLNKKTAEDDLKKAAHTNDIGTAYKTIQKNVDNSNASLSTLLAKQQELNDIAAIYKRVSDPNDSLNISQARYNIYYKYKKNILEGDLKDQQAATEKEIASTKKYAEQSQAILDAYDKANTDDTALGIDKKQYDDDQQRKITQDTAKIEADTIKAKNQLILNDDRSTLAQRLAAIRSNAQQEINVAAASRNDALAKPGGISANGQYSAEALDAVETFNQKRVEISAAAEQKQYQETVSYNDKRLAFLNDINKNALEADAAVQEAISKDQQQELDARLQALRGNIDDRTKIIYDDYNLQIFLAKEHNKTKEEINKIESDKDKALIALTADTQKQIYDIVTSSGERQLKAIEDLNKTQNSGSSVTSQYTRDSNALFASLQKNIFSYESYLINKKNIDDQYAIDLAAAHVKDDKIELQRLQDQENKKLNIQIALAEKELASAKAGGDPNEIKNAQTKLDALNGSKIKADGDIKVLEKKLNDDQEAEEAARRKRTEEAEKKLNDNLISIKQQGYALAKELVDSSYENQINSIQAVIDKQDEQYNNEIAAVQRSTLSQRDQAAEVIILTAEKNAQDTAQKNQQKKDKIAEAKFDRDVAIAEVGWSTGKAIMKDIAGVPFPLSLAVAASDAALGAIQIAAILAKPIPTYGDGVENHPGGLAWVGERFEPEEVNIPGRDPFIVNTPTLLDMPGGSSVTPLDMHNIINDIGWGAIARGAAIVNAVVMDSGSDQIVGALEKHGARMERAFKKSQRKIINRIEVHVDADWQNYLNKKVYGKG